jgi:hypothetical protein
MRKTKAVPSAKVHRKLSRSESGWTVESCMVWISTKQGHLIQSRDLYRSHDEAITDMKRRSMKYLTGRCQPETEEQVQWKIMSVDHVGHITGEHA